eukprot:759109-Hanusia_phi.AAC.5
MTPPSHAGHFYAPQEAEYLGVKYPPSQRLKPHCTTENSVVAFQHAALPLPPADVAHPLTSLWHVSSFSSCLTFREDM